MGGVFADDIIIVAVRWYLRYPLSYRDIKELMAERGVAVDHTTVWRWVDRYAPELDSAFAGISIRDLAVGADETHIRIGGEWAYLYRAVDSAGETVDFFIANTSRSGGQAAFTGFQSGESKRSEATYSTTRMDCLRAASPCLLHAK